MDVSVRTHVTHVFPDEVLALVVDAGYFNGFEGLDAFEKEKFIGFLVETTDPLELGKTVERHG